MTERMQKLQQCLRLHHQKEVNSNSFSNGRHFFQLHCFLSLMPSSSSPLPPCYDKFGAISKAALKKQEDVIDLVNKIPWNDEHLYLVIPPTHHLVDIAYYNIKRILHEKGLKMERSRLSRKEVRWVYYIHCCG